MPPFLHLQNEDDNRTYLNEFIVYISKSVCVSQVEGSQAQSKCYPCTYQPLNCLLDKPSSPKAVWLQHVPAASSVQYRKLGGLSTWSPQAAELSFLVPSPTALYGRQSDKYFGEISTGVECSVGHNSRRGKECRVPCVLSGTFYVPHLLRKTELKQLWTLKPGCQRECLY